MKTKTCTRCNKEQSIDNFYRNTHNSCWSSRCKSCLVEINKVRFIQTKQKWMDYLKQTGKDTCEVCGYNRCFDEIDFHHIDPTQKEFHISSKWSIDPDGKIGQKIKDEIEKCFVVCYNCHRELHTF